MNKLDLIPLKDAPLTIIDGDRGVNYPKKTDFKKSGYCLFLSTSNVKESGFDFSESEYITAEKDSALRKGRVTRNDIVLTTRGTIGNCAYYSEDSHVENMRINSGMVTLRAESKKLNPYYLYIFLRSEIFKSQTRTVTSGSAQPQLPITILREIRIPKHDIDTQESIAKTIASIDEKIELNNRINAELEGMAKLLYDYWFVQFDFPMSAKQAAALGRPDLKGKPYKSSGGKMVYNKDLKREIPDGWNKGTAACLFEFNPTESLKEKEANHFDMACLRTSGFMTDAPFSKKVSGGPKFRNGDVVVARITPCLENGKTGLITRLNDGEIGFGSTEFIVMRGRKQSLSGFGVCLARSEYFRKFAILNMTGTSGRKRIEAPILETISIPIPEAGLLSKFEATLKPMLQKLTANEQQNQQLTELRDWLLPMLMNGQVTVA